jgi:hypothetical protein
MLAIELPSGVCVIRLFDKLTQLEAHDKENALISKLKFSILDSGGTSGSEMTGEGRNVTNL